MFDSKLLTRSVDPIVFDTTLVPKVFLSRERAAKWRRRVAKRREENNLWLLWTGISLSCRHQGQDLALRLGLVDIFANTQINMIGSFDWKYRGEV